MMAKASIPISFQSTALLKSWKSIIIVIFFTIFTNKNDIRKSIRSIMSYHLMGSVKVRVHIAEAFRFFLRIKLLFFIIMTREVYLYKVYREMQKYLPGFTCENTNP